MNKRINQIVLIGTFVGFSWLAMQVVHELGHVLGATITGGKVAAVVLHPLAISRTDVSLNPHPLIEVWAGAVVGSILPLIVFLIVQALKSPGLYLFRFFAGFCLIANGVYIGAGWLATEGADSITMAHNGSPVWTLIFFGLCTAPLGLYLWHKQGEYFGLGEAKGKVNSKAVVVSVTLLAVVIGVELFVNSR